MSTDNAILVENLGRTFGKVEALKDASLEVPAGIVLGLLGPNGAGKTTMVRILSTLLTPTSGRATVAGLDVVKDAALLRSRIALAGQNAAVDQLLTGRENLVLIGRLFRIGAAEAKKRADELLERFELTEAADRRAKTYSGGMRRRLDLAAAIVGRPQVLFLDEPTTGLDPRSRLELWAVIRELVREGTTMMLTTQYLEEADKLCKTIAVIDHGSVIAKGSADDLKSRVGGDVLEMRTDSAEHLSAAAAALRPLGTAEVATEENNNSLRVPVASGGDVLTKAVRELDASGVPILELAIHRPTLDDVFLALTGRLAEAGAETGDAPGDGAKRAARGKKS